MTTETCISLRAYYDEAFTHMGIRLPVAHTSPELQQGLTAEGKANALLLVDRRVGTC